MFRRTRCKTEKRFVWLEIGPVLILCTEGEEREGSRVTQDKKRSRTRRREGTAEGSQQDKQQSGQRMEGAWKGTDREVNCILCQDRRASASQASKHFGGRAANSCRWTAPRSTPPPATSAPSMSLAEHARARRMSAGIHCISNPLKKMIGVQTSSSLLSGKCLLSRTILTPDSGKSKFLSSLSLLFVETCH